MRIRHVHIEHFKRFETLDIDLTAFDCLVGANNSGKTTLLQALALFDFCVHHSLSGKNGQIEIKRRNIAPDEFYVIPVAKAVDLWTDRKTQGKKHHRIIRVTATFEEDQEVTATVDLNYNLIATNIESNDTSRDWLTRLRELRIKYLPVFSTFLPQEERRMPAVLEDELRRGRVHTVIRNLLLDLKEHGHQDALVEVLHRVFPSMKDLAIEFDEMNDRYISVTYAEEGRLKELDVFSAGSGFQQFIYLFGFIILQQPTIVLLDEPDAHLHGSLQHMLLLELRKLVEKGKQVLFATHSRELISRMSPTEIVMLQDGAAHRLHSP